MNGACIFLLGRPAIETLPIVQKVDAVEATNLKAKLPGLFTGLGKLQGPDYVIKLKPEVKPYTLSIPRNPCTPSYKGQRRASSDGTNANNFQGR